MPKAPGSGHGQPCRTCVSDRRDESQHAVGFLTQTASVALPLSCGAWLGRSPQATIRLAGALLACAAIAAMFVRVAARPSALDAAPRGAGAH